MDSGRFGPIDFDRFHSEELPKILAGRGAVISEHDAAALRTIAFQLPDGRAYSFVPDGQCFTVQRGITTAETVIEVPYDGWCSFVWELQTSFALLYSDRLKVTQGSFSQMALWEPVFRVTVDGQDLYDIDHPAAVKDAHGVDLDFTRTFTLDDSDDEIADFLHRAGFVHLRGVMSPEEIADLRVDVEAGIASARPDDHRSWWTTVDGKEVCNRVNYLNDQSPLIAGIGSDSRFLRIAALGGPDLRDAPDRLDGNGVVIKVPGSVGGLADLPWHRDCGMGGHPIKCPMLNVGIQLDPANADNGQLHMIPGSHKGTSRLPSPREAAGLPTVALSTEPGDVTIHFGHTLHSAPPPTNVRAIGRRALYLSFVPPLIFEMVGPGQGYNDVLFTRDDGRIQHADLLH